MRIDALVFLGDLVHYELGVTLHQQAADSQSDGSSQPGKETLVFYHVVRGSEVQLNGILEGVTVRGGEDHPSASHLQSERSVEVHVPVLQGPWFVAVGRRRGSLHLLFHAGNRRPLRDEVGQGLALNGMARRELQPKFYQLDGPLDRAPRTLSIL